MKQRSELSDEMKPEDEEPDSVTLSNLSKIVLPPLGASSYDLAQPNAGGKTISPMDSRYRCWETFMVLLVAYSAWVYPFKVAFMGASAQQGGLYIADNVVAFFFAVDMGLTFFVAYIDRRTHLLIVDRKKIAVSQPGSWQLGPSTGILGKAPWS
ncbi:unnamed protein product [Spirodela intermedia]|uniref:Ion transport domain-containing protein n=1 Tax=Spirodela intermedia TaxID=51605 RepID=A0A7I8KG75_SPIIN|nr:unnamed protein product [Spirodela intermedia]